MCGIGGCVAPEGTSPDRSALERLATALAHRGPDGAGVEIVGSVGLVNTRLAILDPSPRGAQPMVDPDTGWALTYNGEVFNHLELRDELPDRPYRGRSDTETVLRALQAWGVGALERFNGLFAFAALDSRGGRLILARDRLGTKPLYWTKHDGAIWFASELDALLAAGIPRVVDRGSFVKALTYGWAGGEASMIDGVHRLLPGTTLTVELPSLGCTRESWYHPSQEVRAETRAELESRPRSELRELLEDELRGAVERRLLSDVPIGTFCSGGIDSSLVTALAHHAQPQLVAFVASIKGPDGRDEAEYARLVARALGIDLETVTITPDRWRQAFVGAVEHHGQPLPNPTPVSVSLLAEAARRRGVKTVLVGEGADELFGGYWHRHREAYRRYLPRRAFVRHAAESARELGPARSALELGRRLRRDRPSPRIEFGGETDFEALAQTRAAAAYGGEETAGRELAGRFLADLSLTLPHLLNRMDRNVMQHSVEARLPFLDHRLTGLALNLPVESRVLPSQKGILRELAHDHLPARVARRPKLGGMLLGSGRWIAEAARPEFLGSGSVRELLRVGAAEWNGIIEHVHGQQMYVLWSAEVWARLALEGATPSSVEADLWL